MTVYWSLADGTLKFHADNGGAVIHQVNAPTQITTDTLATIHAKWINSQSIPDELAFADAIQNLAVVAAHDFERVD